MTLSLEDVQILLHDTYQILYKGEELTEKCLNTVVLDKLHDYERHFGCKIPDEVVYVTCWNDLCSTLYEAHPCRFVYVQPGVAVKTWNRIMKWLVCSDLIPGEKYAVNVMVNRWGHRIFVGWCDCDTLTCRVYVQEFSDSAYHKITESLVGFINLLAQDIIMNVLQ